MTKCKTFTSKKAAQDWASAVETAILQRDSVGLSQPKTATIADLTSLYRSERKCNEATMSILRVIDREIGHHKLSNISPTIIDEWCKVRMKKCSAATTAVYLSTAGRICRWARNVKQIDVPVEAWGAARSRLRASGHVTVSKRRERIPTLQELQRILRYYEDGESKTTLPMADIIRLCMATGLRRSEVTRITLADVDLANRTVRIRDRKHPVQKFDMLVPLLGDAADVLRRRSRGLTSPDARLFPVAPRSISKSWTAMAHRLGLQGLVFHSLRAYCATELFKLGLSIPHVAAVTGHNDWSVLKRYTHVKPEDVLNVVERLSA